MTKRTIGAQTALRVLVGFVFLVSGFLKFLYENQGPLRFAKLGLPAPALTAYAVGAVEVVGGALVIAGLFTRHAAAPLALDMVAALVTTKLPLLFGAGPEPVAALPKIGVLAFAYQARLDLTLIAVCIYLVASGSGQWSLDALFRRRGPADELAPAAAADAPRVWS